MVGSREWCTLQPLVEVMHEQWMWRAQLIVDRWEGKDVGVRRDRRRRRAEHRHEAIESVQMVARGDRELDGVLVRDAEPVRRRARPGWRCSDRLVVQQVAKQIAEVEEKNGIALI